MNRILFAVAWLASSLGVFGAATPTFESFSQLFFKTNSPPPWRITIPLSSQYFDFHDPTNGITITNVSGVVGSTNLIILQGTNVSYDFEPTQFTATPSVIAGVTNIEVDIKSGAVITNLIRFGDGRNAGTETWTAKSQILSLGDNVLTTGANSQLILISPTNDASQVWIHLNKGVASVEHLEIYNLTNASPPGGAFHMTNNSPIPDSLSGGIVRLLQEENWTATNGCGIELRFDGLDWIEQFRWDISGSPTLITNVFNNIRVRTNLIVHGDLTINNVTVTTNDLWTTQVSGTGTNLQPVNLALQPMIQRGLAVGSNTVVSGLLPITIDDMVLGSIANTDVGDPPARFIYVAQATSNNNPRSWLSDVITTNTHQFAIAGNDGTHQVNASIQTAGGSDIQLFLQQDATVFTLLQPTRGNGNPPYEFGSTIKHTTGDFLEANNLGDYMIRENMRGDVAVGEKAGQSLDPLSSFYNVMIGKEAGTAVTVGNGNILEGYQAGHILTSGGFNVILGHQAGLAVDGSDNVIVGTAAGSVGGGFGQATLVGDSAGRVNTAGLTVALGASALFRHTSGIHDTSIGFQSLEFDTTGSENTALGYKAGGSVTTQTNTISIGSMVTATNNNEIVIGNVNNTKVIFPNVIFDDSSTANDTRFLIWDVTGGALRRVTIGANDSGGAGFRVLRIPN